MYQALCVCGKRIKTKSFNDYQLFILEHNTCHAGGDNKHRALTFTDKSDFTWQVIKPKKRC